MKPEIGTFFKADPLMPADTLVAFDPRHSLVVAVINLPNFPTSEEIRSWPSGTIVIMHTSVRERIIEKYPEFSAAFLE